MENAYLQELDAAMGMLSPGAKKVINRVQQMTGAQFPAPQPEVAPVMPEAQPMRPAQKVPTLADAPTPAGVEGAATSSIPAAAPMRPAAAPVKPMAPMGAPPMTETANMRELNRLQSSTSGINQIKNPWARVPLQIADAVGSGLFPRIAMNVPGTQAHHDLLTEQARAGVGTDIDVAEADTENRLRQAQAVNAESMPEMNEARLSATLATSELNQAKQAEVERSNRAKEEAARATAGARLRIAGFDPDTGEPLADDQLSEPLRAQRALTELRESQAEAAAANIELKQAELEQAPEKAEIAAIRLQQAQQRLNIASARLGLSGQQFEFRSQGTVGGVAPPGTLLTEGGQPVGTANAANVQPTGTERQRGDLAASALEQLDVMRAIVQNRPEMFGPGAGRAQQFATWIGSQDPDASKFRAARQIVADHAMAVFGGRSQYASQALEIASGRFKDNPEAILAGMDPIEQAMRTVGTKGEVRTVGGGAPKVPPKTDTQSGGVRVQKNSKGEFRYSTDGGKTWQSGKPPQ